MPLDRTAYNALVDDTGAGDGTVWAKTPIKNVILDPVDAALAPLESLAIASPQTITLTGNQNDVAVPANCRMLRCNNATLLTITGIAAGTPGQFLAIHAVGVAHVALTPQAAGTASAAANRLINTVTIGVTMLAAGTGVALYQYDGTLTRWKLVHHEQGAPIDVPYNAADFTASSGSWTVDAGDLLAYNYYLQGRTLFVHLYCATTSVTGTPNTLRVTLPNSYKILNRAALCTLMYINATGGWTAGGTFDLVTAATVIALWAIYQGTWAASTNLTQLQGSVSMELQ